MTFQQKTDQIKITVLGFVDSVTVGRAADPHMATSKLLGMTSPVLGNTGVMMPLFENNPIKMN